jgi:2-oxo-3-hexenedioate decarboxylase
VSALAKELFDAYTSGDRVAVAPSAREGGCDLASAYAVEAELTQMRRAEGRTTVGRKIGAANKAVWRLLGIETVLWGNMYDDTVHYAKDGVAAPSLARMRAPKLEPEVVMKLRSVPTSRDAAAVLGCVEWIAFGYEVVDNPFPDWKFKAEDLVASFGFHAALVVGTPRPVESGSISSLVEQLATFTVRLSKNGEVVAEGGGKNVLENAALCLGEFAAALAAQPGAEPLRPGEVITTGTLTVPPAIAAGERWEVVASGIDLPSLTIDLKP